MHFGVDFGWDGGSGGLPIYAVQGGTVVNVGPASGFGQWIVIDHPTEDGSGTTVYGHIIPEVRYGQRVEAGQRIGHINPDSRTNGGVAPHLHLEWHRAVWSPPGPNRLDHSHSSPGRCSRTRCPRRRHPLRSVRVTPTTCGKGSRNSSRRRETDDHLRHRHFEPSA